MLKLKVATMYELAFLRINHPLQYREKGGTYWHMLRQYVLYKKEVAFDNWWRDIDP